MVQSNNKKKDYDPSWDPDNNVGIDEARRKVDWKGFKEGSPYYNKEGSIWDTDKDETLVYIPDGNYNSTPIDPIIIIINLVIIGVIILLAMFLTRYDISNAMAYSSVLSIFGGCYVADNYLYYPKGRTANYRIIFLIFIISCFNYLIMARVFQLGLGIMETILVLLNIVGCFVIAIILWKH
jgi:hypothetical protein